MASFLEKLKKGMGMDETEVLKETSKPAKSAAIKRIVNVSGDSPKKERVKKTKEVPASIQTIKRISLPQKELKKMEIKEFNEKGEKVEIEIKEEPEEKTIIKQEKEAPVAIERPSPEEKKKPEPKEKWSNLGGEPEGQLAIDVYQTEKYLIIQSAIAGVEPEGLDISLEKDIITIKGWRSKQIEDDGDYFMQECYWGPFSREIITPVEIDPDRAEATMKDCILTIKMPKILREKKRKISIKGLGK